MIVHGGRPSPFARKVLVTLEEKGIPYEQKDLSPVPKTPELLAMHPMGKIPILETDDGSYVPDSSVICAYLERIQPQPSLFPSDPADFARALFLEEYADTKMVEAIGGIFFEHFVKVRVFGQEPDAERVDQLVENELPPVCDYLESQLTEGRDTVLASFSIADVALGAHLGGLTFANLGIDGSRWPKLAAYFETTLARPSFKTAMG